MLYIPIDIVPYGDWSRRRNLAELVIANVGQSASGHAHDYAYVYSEPKTLAGPPILRTGFIDDYDRNAPVGDIVYAVLEAASKDGENTAIHKRLIGVLKNAVSGPST